MKEDFKFEQFFSPHDFKQVQIFVVRLISPKNHAPIPKREVENAIEQIAKGTNYIQYEIKEMVGEVIRKKDLTNANP